MRTAVEVVGLMSVAYAAANNLCYLMLWPLARHGMKKAIRRRGWAWHEEALRSPLTPGVSIVVPAFNEEAMILDSVASILGQRYPVFEIVIVDDGSTDATAARIIEEHGLHRVEPAPRNLLQYESVRELYRGGSPTDITLVRKDNGGRADALNAGLDVARHPYVCVTDADSILDPDGLTVMMRPVQEDPERVIAVGGTVRVANSSRVESGRASSRACPRGGSRGSRSSSISAPFCTAVSPGTRSERSSSSRARSASSGATSSRRSAATGSTPWARISS